MKLEPMLRIITDSRYFPSFKRYNVFLRDSMSVNFSSDSKIEMRLLLDLHGLKIKKLKSRSGKLFDFILDDGKGL